VDILLDGFEVYRLRWSLIIYLNFLKNLTDNYGILFMQEIPFDLTNKQLHNSISIWSYSLSSAQIIIDRIS